MVQPKNFTFLFGEVPYMIIAEMQRGMNIEKCACLFFLFRKERLVQTKRRE